MINGFGMQLLFSPQNSNLETLDKTLTPEYRKLANIILRRIRDQKVGSHYELIIGPRGSGKTHILSFIYKTIKKEFADGEKLKVIRLSEEERGLTSLLDFLLACLRACNLSPEEIAGNVMRGDAVTALSAAEDLFRNQTGNIPMQIFMENLSDIFRGFKNNDLLDLRGFFQTHPNISLIASSVILYKSSSRPDHPFYGFFNIHPLESLDRKNARIFLATLAEANKKNELAKELRKEQAQAKVNAIYDLTGGNHRLLSMLANVLDVAGLAELVGPFVQMVDRELTPYYQQRLSSLSPQQNKILRAIADHHGKALAVKEIAYFTFLASQVVSRQLHDLYHGLFIKRNKIGRESFYELNEPLLRIVLDMKEGRDGPLPLIVNFLRFWYAEKELRKLEKEAPADIQTYYHEALREMQKIEREVTFKEQISVSDEITIEVSRAKVGERAMDDQLKETQTLLDEAYSFHEQEQYLEAITILDKLIKRFVESDQPEILEQFSRALVYKGVTLGKLDRSEDSIAVYDEVFDRFGESDQPELLEPVARALVNKGVMLGQLDRSEDSIAVYDEVIERFGKSDQPELLEGVARALVNKGVTLGQLDRSEDEIAVYDELIERFGKSDKPELLERVARALVNKGVMLGQLDRSEDAIAVYDEVIERFGESDQPELLERVARALVNKGVTLGQLDRSEDEIAVYDEVIERFGESDQPELLERVAKALVNKGVTLGQLDRSADEIAVYDEVIERFGESDQPELLEGVSSAHIGSAIIRSALNNYSEALADFEKALRIKPDQSRAHAGYIEMLFALGQVDNALVALNEAFDIFTDSPSDLSYIFSRLINRFNKSENILKRVVDLFVNKEQKSSLVEGTLVWLKGLLPMSEEEARDLEGAEKVLTNVFANVPETQTVLEVFVAVRQDAMGDPKALMSIPLELRRLIEEEKSN
ncbi:MAG: tetratricopeptide repeat protein [Candidatus Marinimicrobia bacterium]|nr:tetratricopeptide repeat protein [Candidatus Neomarinimicrobiota bacterium]